MRRLRWPWRKSSGAVAREGIAVGRQCLSYTACCHKVLRPLDFSQTCKTGGEHQLAWISHLLHQPHYRYRMLYEAEISKCRFRASNCCFLTSLQSLIFCNKLFWYSISMWLMHRIWLMYYRFWFMFEKSLSRISADTYFTISSRHQPLKVDN